ncbi:MAG: hypothetical protein K9H16_07075 [Bacteroidales bacterium]|nr:hypothetical protein [Bacteroidales bacterium]
MNKIGYYHIFADLFRYPDQKLTDVLFDFQRLVVEHFPKLDEKARILVLAITKKSLTQQQEYYLKTFDVQSVCYLDLGYIMFGEDYKRAQLLVNLQLEHQKASVDCGHELGDHLPNVLMLLSKTNDPEFAQELGFVIILQAVRFMLAKFKNSDNLYKNLLEILLAFLQQDFKGEGLAEYAMPEQLFDGANDFLMPSPNQAICDTMCNKRKSF